MTTLLTLCKDVADEIGLPRPATVIGSPDDTARRLLAMSNREGRSLVEEADWTILQRLHTFTTTASDANYDLPSDYSRLIRDSEWDRAEQRPLIGPITTQQWEEIQSGAFNSGLAFTRFRIVRSSSSTSREFQIEPTPTTSGDTLAFWYVSNAWCSDSAGSTLQSAWAADDDENLLDDDLMRLGMIVRFKRAVGLDYGSEADEYMQMLKRKRSQDRPSPTLSMGRSPRLRLIGPGNLPETGLTGAS